MKTHYQSIGIAMLPNTPKSITASYLEKIKNDAVSMKQKEILDKQKKEYERLVRETYSEKNAYLLLDFLIHATCAQTNIGQILNKIKSNPKYSKLTTVLKEFHQHFSKLNDDFDIMCKQDDKNLDMIVTEYEYFVTNIAFLNPFDDAILNKTIAEYTKHKDEVGKTVDYINDNNSHDYFPDSLTTEQTLTSSIAELVVNLIFIEYLCDKFVNVSGYVAYDIRKYCKKTLYLLIPFIKEGFTEHFFLDFDNELLKYYKSVCSKFYEIKTSSKIEFTKFIKAFYIDRNKIIEHLSIIKEKLQMEQITKLAELNNEAQVQGELFYNKGNKTAGTRLRKIMLEIKNLTAEIRKNVQEVKKQ